MKSTKADSTLLPGIGSSEFKKLHYKEQLFIMKLFYHDPDKYKLLCGSPGATPAGLEYVDHSVGLIFKYAQLPETHEEIPIEFINSCWCAYLTYYNPLWWEEYFSPVDDLGFDHKRIFGINLFNFPLISLDSPGLKILKWLREQPKKTRELNDVIYYLVKLRSAWQYFRDEIKPESDPIDIWNLSVANLNEYLSIADINGAYPIAQDSPLIDLIETDTLVPLLGKVRSLDKRYFIPLVPSELYLKTQFTIKDWDFLVSK